MPLLPLLFRHTHTHALCKTIDEFFTWISPFATVKFQSTTDASTVNKLTGNQIRKHLSPFYSAVVDFVTFFPLTNPFDGCNTVRNVNSNRTLFFAYTVKLSLISVSNNPFTNHTH